MYPSLKKSLRVPMLYNRPVIFVGEAMQGCYFPFLVFLNGGSMSLDSSNTRQMERSFEAFLGMAPHAVTRARRTGHHLLLAMPIGKRLALGFLIPVLVVFLSLGSISVQSQQLLSNVATFNQHLLHAYTSLTTAVSTLQLTHANILGALTDAGKPQISQATLREDQATTQRLAVSYDSTLKAYLQHDVLALSPGLSALMKEAGHSAQVDEQRIRSNEALSASGNLNKANTLETAQAEQTYANAMTSVLILMKPIRV
jgi:hypothetical protein